MDNLTKITLLEYFKKVITNLNRYTFHITRKYFYFRFKFTREVNFMYQPKERKVLQKSNKSKTATSSKGPKTKRKLIGGKIIILIKCKPDLLSILRVGLYKMQVWADSFIFQKLKIINYISSLLI